MLHRLVSLLVLGILALAWNASAAPNPTARPSPTFAPNIDPRMMGDFSNPSKFIPGSKLKLPFLRRSSASLQNLMASMASQDMFPQTTTSLSSSTDTAPTATSTGAWKAISTATSTPPAYALSSAFAVNCVPTVREYYWTITLADAAPDGFGRNVIAINGQTPGPLIEANEGDTIIVHVTNKLTDIATIHWHGMNQNGTQSNDGMPAYTQCPIPAGGSFTYKFKPTGQWGSYWYHSHTTVQYTDGLYGPMVIHSTNEKYKRGVDYDEEVVFFLSDWYHDRGTTIADELEAAGGYNGSIAPPPPQSMLINGRGLYNCSNVANSTDPSPFSCITPSWPELVVVPNKRYRFRFIGGSSHAQFDVSMDNHTFSVIATDGTDIVPTNQTFIPVHSGQRYDAIVTTNQGPALSNFWLRAVEVIDCLPYLDPTATNYAQLVVRYRTVNSGAPVITAGTGLQQPNTTPQTNSTSGSCLDLADADLVPVISEVPINTNASNVVSYSTNFGAMVSNSNVEGRFYVNNITATMHPYQPFLRTISQGGQVSSDVAMNEFLDDVWVGDIIINNEDPQTDHPYHLHSRSFHVVARGSGVMTAALWSNLSFNTVTAPLRDTVVVASSSYAVLRIRTDTPGVWALHCHIAFHLSTGFLGGIIVHPKALEKQASVVWPTSADTLCAASPRSLTNSTILP